MLKTTFLIFLQTFYYIYSGIYPRFSSSSTHLTSLWGPFWPRLPVNFFLNLSRWRAAVATVSRNGIIDIMRMFEHSNIINVYISLVSLAAGVNKH